MNSLIWKISSFLFPGDIIRGSLSKLERIELAFIYSFAKGEKHPRSDIDIMMIVGSTPDKEISEVPSDAERKLKRTVNYSVYERKEIKTRLKKKGNFILPVFSEPRIVLPGSKNDELFRTD